MEGWVELSFMVDTQGQAYEIQVAESVGHQSFVDAAVKALEATPFRPAMVGEEAVHGSSSMIYRFVMEDGSDGARPQFATRYRRFVTALNEQTQEEAAEALSVLEDGETQNNYEFAFLNLARYQYAQRYGTTLEQMEYLRKALGENVHRPEFASYLGEDAVAPRRALLQLQVRNLHFREALDTLELMRLKGDEEGLELFGELAMQLEEFRAIDDPYAVPGRLDETGSWRLSLFRNAFYLDELSGIVEELKLRCQRSYVFFEFDPQTQYNVSDSAGVCTLEVIGDADTTFSLVQQ